MRPNKCNGVDNICIETGVINWQKLSEVDGLIDTEFCNLFDNKPGKLKDASIVILSRVANNPIDE